MTQTIQESYPDPFEGEQVVVPLTVVQFQVELDFEPQPKKPLELDLDLDLDPEEKEEDLDLDRDLPLCSRVGTIRTDKTRTRMKRIVV